MQMVPLTSTFELDAVFEDKAECSRQVDKHRLPYPARARFLPSVKPSACCFQCSGIAALSKLILLSLALPKLNACSSFGLVAAQINVAGLTILPACFSSDQLVSARQRSNGGPAYLQHRAQFGTRSNVPGCMRTIPRAPGPSLCCTEPRCLTGQASTQGLAT